MVDCCVYNLLHPIGPSCAVVPSWFLLLLFLLLLCGGVGRRPRVLHGRGGVLVSSRPFRLEFLYKIPRDRVIVRVWLIVVCIISCIRLGRIVLLLFRRTAAASGIERDRERVSCFVYVFVIPSSTPPPRLVVLFYNSCGVCACVRVCVCTGNQTVRVCVCAILPVMYLRVVDCCVFP